MRLTDTGLGVAVLALGGVVLCALLFNFVGFLVAIRGADPGTRLRLFGQLTSALPRIVEAFIRRSSRQPGRNRYRSDRHNPRSTRLELRARPDRR